MPPGIVPGKAFQAYPIEKRLQDIPERLCLSPEELEVVDLCLDCSHHESGSHNQQRMDWWKLPKQQTANIHIQLHWSLWREEENLISQSPISSIKWCCFFLPMELAHQLLLMISLQTKAAGWMQIQPNMSKHTWTTFDQNTQQSHQRAFHPEQAEYLQLSESVVSTQPTWTAGYTLTRRDQNKSRPAHLNCSSDQFISFINICLRYCRPVETIFPVSNKKFCSWLFKQRKRGTWKQMFLLQYQSVSQWCLLCVKGFIFTFSMHENRQGSRNRSAHFLFLNF